MASERTDNHTLRPTIEPIVKELIRPLENRIVPIEQSIEKLQSDLERLTYLMDDMVRDKR